MPPMPPPGGIAGSSFFGASATMASVVIIRPAMEAAFCNAVRVTLAKKVSSRYDTSAIWSRLASPLTDVTLPFLFRKKSRQLP
ncbi:hypothetical protein J9A72_27275 [Klebsiella pneumoniae]